MKNLLSLYPTDLLLTRDVSGVSQQVTLNAAQLVTLFGTVVALVRYKKGGSQIAFGYVMMVFHIISFQSR